MSARKSANGRQHHGHDATPGLLRTQARADLAARAYAAAEHGTESFREQDIGADLAYLLGAILTGGFVDWTPEAMRDTPALLPILRAEFAPDSELWKYIRLPADQSAPFKVGEFVAVVDLRDGAVVEPRTQIKSLAMEDGKEVATLEAGFRVATRCLRHLP